MILLGCPERCHETRVLRVVMVDVSFVVPPVGGVRYIEDAPETASSMKKSA